MGSVPEPRRPAGARASRRACAEPPRGRAVRAPGQAVGARRLVRSQAGGRRVTDACELCGGVHRDVRETNNKPSEVRSKKRIVQVHLKPALGATKLDAIGVEQIEL